MLGAGVADLLVGLLLCPVIASCWSDWWDRLQVKKLAQVRCGPGVIPHDLPDAGVFLVGISDI